MKRDKDIEEFLKNFKQRLLKEMPKVQATIQLYEERLASGKLTKSPSQSPLFNE